MEENKEVTEVKEEPVQNKKNNTPMLIVVVALLLIGAGVALVMTGNNKALFGNETKKEEAKQNTDVPTSQKNPNEILTEEEALRILEADRAANHAEEGWVIGSIKILGKSSKQNANLVQYEEVTGDIIVVKQTVFSYSEEGWTADLPGWLEGERDLTDYDFIIGVIEEPGKDEPVIELPTEEVPTEEVPTEEVPTQEEPQTPIETPKGAEGVEVPAEDNGTVDGQTNNQ